MPEQSPLIQNATTPTSHGSDGPVTRWLLVSLSLTNYVAQIAGGAAIDSAGPFTAFSPTRLPQITLGAGGANPVIYTLTGYRIDDGSASPTEVTQTITAAGAGTYKATMPMIITRLQSNIDPVGTTDLQAGDTWVYPPSRAIRVGAAGDIACRPADNVADVVLSSVLAGIDPTRIKIVRITSTTATGLALGW